jgi:hypothetical protein
MLLRFVCFYQFKSSQAKACYVCAEHQLFALQTASLLVRNCGVIGCHGRCPCAWLCLVKHNASKT